MKITINQASQCLNLPPDTIERWIRQGRIPMRKEGDNCIFKKSVMEKWAKSHNLSLSKLEKDSEHQQTDSHQENLVPVMRRGGVLHNIAGDDVTSVLKSATDNISFLAAEDKEELLKRLLEREELTSTGVGKGIAIPHPRTPLSDRMEHPAIVTCFLETPINFGAIDDRPVFVMFILLSNSTKNHLHLLSRLAFCVRDNAFVEFLKTAPDSVELSSKIADFEKQLSVEE